MQALVIQISETQNAEVKIDFVYLATQTKYYACILPF
jgi:hypothetical protein